MALDGTDVDESAGYSRRAFLGRSLAKAAGFYALTRGLSGCGGRSTSTKPAGRRKVVVLVQENHTTDNYFGSLSSVGVNAEPGWPTTPANALPDNTRLGYFKWLQARRQGMPGAEHSQIDSATKLPFYNQLALSGAFFENHFTALGTDSTPNHLVILGGQSPVLQNPSGNTTQAWDMPSLPQLAQRAGRTWKGYTGPNEYPFSFYKSLTGSPNLVRSDQFEADARAGALPDLSFVYHDPPYDEHPPSDVTLGHNKIWSYTTAAVDGGEWDNTVFMLTWDDWGGFDDHVLTPVLEYTPEDNVPVGGGPRVPLLMFGGPVLTGIDSRWCSHAAIPRTAIQILGLPPLGISRVDDDPGLGDRLDWNHRSPPPPRFGTTIAPPAAPAAPRAANPLPPYPARPPVAMEPVVLNGGTRLPIEPYGLLPRQPAPPTSSDPTKTAPLVGTA